MDNYTQYFHARYQLALSSWKDGQKMEADESCRALIADLSCPPLLHVHALQLRSRCTNIYYKARELLEQCFGILQDVAVDIGDDDGTIDYLRNHTQLMLKEIEDIWNAQ